MRDKPTEDRIPEAPRHKEDDLDLKLKESWFNKQLSEGRRRVEALNEAGKMIRGSPKYGLEMMLKKESKGKIVVAQNTQTLFLPVLKYEKYQDSSRTKDTKVKKKAPFESERSKSIGRRPIEGSTFGKVAE